MLEYYTRSGLINTCIENTKAQFEATPDSDLAHQDFTLAKKPALTTVIASKFSQLLTKKGTKQAVSEL